MSDIIKNKLEAFERISALVVDFLGVDKEDITPDITLESIGMDEPECVKFLLHIDQEFDSDIDDTYFLPRNDTDRSKLWRVRPIQDLTDYCAENLMQ